MSIIRMDPHYRVLIYHQNPIVDFVIAVIQAVFALFVSIALIINQFSSKSGSFNVILPGIGMGLYAIYTIVIKILLFPTNPRMHNN